MSNFFASLFPQDDYALLGVILVLPLLGAFVNGLWGDRLGKPAVRVMAVSAVVISFVAAVGVLFALDHWVDASAHQENGKLVHDHVRLSWTLWQWMHTNGGRTGGSVPIDVKFSVDALSAVMMLIITGIGSLIHLYATSYMAQDRSFARFFAYLNLFIFAMLVLVMADNLPVLFVGWEGVGLCSYLLIGFWYEKGANATAGKKAFIANRIGDFGLLVAMFLLAHYLGALDWHGIENSAASLVEPSTDAMRIHLWPIGGGRYEGAFALLQPKNPLTISAATAVGLALLLGCTGKSAQIPLYTWLPDAMAGPTPVSALIHAATMVTAGVYLVCRLNFVFVLSPFVMAMVAIVGVVTAFYAATIALVQYDIKKVLAYSTVSQLGFMFLGVGVGAFTAGFFHVLTHAFFKACLFLGAGSVIHAMHGRIHDDDKAQDMRSMGGLRKYMPYTYWTFVVATAAIIGTPLLSGFFSKDEILFRSYVNRLSSPMYERLKHEGALPYTPPEWLGPVLYWTAVAAATLTAFYMCRALFMTFYGDFRGWTIGRPSQLAKMEREKADHDDEGHPHHEDLATPGHAPHESPWQMTVPLIVLATGAAFAGILNMGPLHLTPLDHWLEPVFEASTSHAVKIREGGEHLEWTLMLGGLGAFAAGTYAAYYVYIARKGADEKEYARLSTRFVQAMSGVLLLTIAVLAWVLIPWTPGGFARYVVCGGFAAGGLYLMATYKQIGLDGVYEETVVSPTDALADTAAQIDQWVVDGILAKVTAFVVSAFGTVLRALQNGVVHLYAAMMVVGIAVVGWFFVLPHASATVAAKGSDFTVSTGVSGGYEDYTYEWSQCDPDKKQWEDEWTAASKVEEAAKRADEQRRVTEQIAQKHARCEAPGDKWSPITKEGFGNASEVTLHLEADGDALAEESRPVRLRARNVFSSALGGYTASSIVYVPRPAKAAAMGTELGINP
ncbi:MAG TPA: NADH-quinone oxidoreductase subunit L [Polyangiaceae bacterium]|nr:NADH-quinone oxidoreductase subunit L [Polyangiaceae bacterium]